jgi:hypothetical protein
MNKLKIILINLLNVYVQVINEALLLNEDIDIGWLFVRKANFERPTLKKSLPHIPYPSNSKTILLNFDIVSCKPSWSK